MSEENISQVEEKCCLDDANPVEEISVETMTVMDEVVKGDDVLLPAAETNHVNLRRYSTGALDKRACKAQVQTRYRGNQTSSTHDLCKHGKRREDDLVVKPWKLVKKKNVQGGDLGKGETLRMPEKVSKPDKSPLRVAKKETGCEIAKSCDGLRVKKNETKSVTPSDSAVVRMAKKTNLDVKKVSRISENKSPKKDILKNKEKNKIDELDRCDDALETTTLDVKKVSRISERKSSKEEKNLKNKEKTKIDEPDKCDDALGKTNLDVKKVSRISETKSSKEDPLKNKEKTKIDEPDKCDDAVEKTNLDVKKVLRISGNKSSKEDLLKNKEQTKIDEPDRCDDAVGKTNLGVKKVSRISGNKSSKEDLLKNLKNKERTKIDESDDAVEKTLYVVESSIEKKKKSITSVKSEIQQSSERKTLRSSGKKSLSLIPSLSPSSEVVKESRVTRSDPKPIRQTTSRSKTGLSEKKEFGCANLVTNSKTESKIIRPKRIGLKVTPPPPPTKQLMSFKKGKVVELKPEDSTTTLLKFKKRVVQEPKLRSDVNKKKKNLKDKRAGVGKVNGEGKREKVVLRHRKVEVKKKLQTLFNNVIEETVNKLEEARKSKVEALVGAFETVISLQDDKTKTSQKKKISREQEIKSTSSQVVEG